MKLNHHIKALIAVGAAITANCQPCLQSAMMLALENGAGEEEITEAIEVGKKVRAGAVSKIDRFTADLGHAASLTSKDGCGCQSVQG